MIAPKARLLKVAYTIIFTIERIHKKIISKSNSFLLPVTEKKQIKGITSPLSVCRSACRSVTKLSKTCLDYHSKITDTISSKLYRKWRISTKSCWAFHQNFTGQWFLSELWPFSVLFYFYSMSGLLLLNH
jgi:hypothetical protein